MTPGAPRARRRLLLTLAVALLAQAATLAPLPPVARTLALLLWAAVVPGHLLVEGVIGRFGAPPMQLEWGVYTVAAGYGLLIGVVLLTSYLPGPLTAWQLHLAVDLLLAALAVVAWRTAGAPVDAPTPLPRWEVVALVAVVALAALLRLTNLGYAEYHGDEARAVLRAAAVVQGDAGVLFLHKKGPAEILLPAAVLALTGPLTETTARLPLALANLTAVAALFWLGRRLFGPVAGVAAALLLTVDGFGVGFGRIVQYQSLVILLTATTLLVLARLVETPRGSARGLALAAGLTAAGLWAHYEAGLVAVPALYLLGVLWTRHPLLQAALARGLGGALALGAGLLALFYAPFLLHPQFGATYTYLVDRRIAGGGLPTNNVADWFVRATTYNSIYYALALIAVLVVGLLWVYRRSLGPRWGSVVGAALLIVLGLTVATPAWATLGGRDWLVVVFVAALLPAWLGRGVDWRERMVWLWFGGLATALLFFTDKPRTHVYVFLSPWLLLAGLLAQAAWAALAARRPRRRLAWAGGVTAVVVAALFGGYVYQMFAQTQIERIRLWQTAWPAGYWRPYAMLDNRALFGFPLANGWKVAGQLYAEGVLTGDYATNEVEFWTPIWYTHGRLRCEDEATWFFQIANPQPDPAGYRTALETRLAQEYQPWGVVTIGGDPRMVIHQRGHTPVAVQAFRLEDYADAFDATATADLPLGYPVIEPAISHAIGADFGGLITLEGYDLAARGPQGAPIAAGDTLTLTLYWRAQRAIDASYKVFNQSYYGDGVMVAQADGYPVCGGRGTWLWDPGELIADVHTLPVAPDAPDGLYPLYTGLYIEETLARLDVLDAAGTPIGDQVHLTDIRIGVE